MSSFLGMDITMKNFNTVSCLTFSLKVCLIVAFILLKGSILFAISTSSTYDILHYKELNGGNCPIVLLSITIFVLMGNGPQKNHYVRFYNGYS